MRNFDHAKLEEVKVNVHLIEHAADDKKHEVTAKLLTEFMTPIDREDILELLKQIDDITDAIEEVSLKLFLYDYKELPPDTIPFMELTLDCIRKTEECLKHFQDYQKCGDYESFDSSSRSSRRGERYRIY
jgi:predicted phosphate transport protein (TIGR00153 family)